jgi:cell division protein FtsI (penicillin-binding protein 3)
VQAIKSVKGIGLKTAQRILVDLKDKIQELDVASNVVTPVAATANQQIASEAVAALSMLGFASCSKPTSTIDPDLQTKVDSILQVKMSEINATSGQAIVMDMKGNIKAMVGNGQKQSSSLMRPISLHKALETGKVHLSDTVDTEEGIAIINGDTIKDHNWHRGGYGKITLKQGLACNSSIAVAKATQMAGVEAVDSLVTPLEMLKLFNGIIKNDSLKSAIRYYITDGLGKQASSDKVEVAGFSGRRTISLDNSEKPEYAVEFIGYFPADEPKYSIIVSMNKIGLPASGGLMAGSVFKEIADYMNN